MEMTAEQIAELQQKAQEAEQIRTQLGSLQDTVKKLEENNKALLSEKLEAKRLADEAAEEVARKTGDVKSLEKSWAEKLEAERKAADSIRQTLDRVTAGATAATVAAELFGEHAELMADHVARRLRTEYADGNPAVRVLDAAGNLTALSVEDLKNEFRNNAKFAPFIVASRANGGGNANQGGGGGGGSGKATMKRADFELLDPVSKAAFIKDGGTLRDA